MSLDQLQIAHTHDAFFKQSMSHPEVAKEFFEMHLPARVKKMVDFSTLTPQKESFIDDTLRTGIVDMLFSVNFTKETGYLYTLVEHVRHEIAHIKSPPSPSAFAKASADKRLRRDYRAIALRATADGTITLINILKVKIYL